MIYIRKRRTPAEIEEKAEKIKKTPGSTYEKLSLPEDTNQLRTLFDQIPKDEIREKVFVIVYVHSSTVGEIKGF